MIPIEKIDPNPHQARCDLGNIQELQDSIKSKGSPRAHHRPGQGQPLRDHRRRTPVSSASKNLGLERIAVPSTWIVEDSEAMEIALIENLQRKDLDIFEEADGLQALADIHSYNHAADLGEDRQGPFDHHRDPGHRPDPGIGQGPHPGGRSVFGRSTHDRDRQAEIGEDDMVKLARGDRRSPPDPRGHADDLAKYLKGKTKKLKYYAYNFVPSDTDRFRMRLEFKKQTVSKQEIIAVLQEIIDQIRKTEGEALEPQDLTPKPSRIALRVPPSLVPDIS
ncbi:MAG: ParB N-terminal domain-containing protein [Chromatiales bacterium]|nr:ParB N-terminal domain-containing protein [Chromatiales bacterium]